MADARVDTGGLGPLFTWKRQATMWTIIHARSQACQCCVAASTNLAELNMDCEFVAKRGVAWRGVACRFSMNRCPSLTSHTRRVSIGQHLRHRRTDLPAAYCGALESLCSLPRCGRCQVYTAIVYTLCTARAPLVCTCMVHALQAAVATASAVRIVLRVEHVCDACAPPIVRRSLCPPCRLCSQPTSQPSHVYSRTSIPNPFCGQRSGFRLRMRT